MDIMAVTLKTIAEKAQVSTMAVSSVLNNSNNTRVSAEKRERIKRIAADLGYFPNQVARILGGGSSKLIGVLTDSYIAHGYYRLIKSIEHEVSRNGYSVMLAEEHDRVDLLLRGYETFRTYGVDGIICISHNYPSEETHVYQSLSKDPRVVFFDKPNSDMASFSYVEPDRAEACRLAATYFQEHGRKRLAFLSLKTESLNVWERRRGFVETCEKADCFHQIFEAAPAMEEEIDLVIDEVNRFIEQCLIPHRIDAVVGVTDIYSAFLIRELNARKIRVPEEVAVIGHGNDLFTRMITPGLASVDDLQEEQGKEASKLLFRLIKSNAVAPAGLETRISPRLIVRPSAGN